MITAQIPGAAASHVQELNDREDAGIIGVLAAGTVKRVGRGSAVVITTTPELARELADRLRSLADVERMVDSYANAGLARACDKGAARIAAALNEG